MSLPAILEELAVLLPERFLYDWPRRQMKVEVPMTVGGYSVSRMTYYWDDDHWELEEPCAFLWIEAALREECEARGWYISLSSQPGPGETEWDVEISGIQKAFTASTPAEALAAAMVGALAAVSESVPKLK